MINFLFLNVLFLNSSVESAAILRIPDSKFQILFFSVALDMHGPPIFMCSPD